MRLQQQGRPSSFNKERLKTLNPAFYLPIEDLNDQWGRGMKKNQNSVVTNDGPSSELLWEPLSSLPSVVWKRCLQEISAANRQTEKLAFYRVQSYRQWQHTWHPYHQILWPFLKKMCELLFTTCIVQRLLSTIEVRGPLNHFQYRKTLACLHSRNEEFKINA